MDKKYISDLAKALLWAGGLNIGLMGLLEYNLLLRVFKPWPTLLDIIYLSIGAAAVYSIAGHNK